MHWNPLSGATFRHILRRSGSPARKKAFTPSGLGGLRVPSARRRQRLLELERLEDRTVPTLAVNVQSGAFNMTVFDGGPLDTNPLPNQISVQFTNVPGFSAVNVGLAQTNSPGDSTGSLLLLNYGALTTGTSGGTVNISASATGFTGPPQAANPLTLTSQIAGTIAGTGSATGQMWSDVNNNLFGTTVVGVNAFTPGPQGPFTSSPFAGSASVNFNRDTGPYSLTQTVTLSMDTNSQETGSIQGTVPPPTQMRFTPQINTLQQPATATVGDTIADKAIVTGGDNPTGTVTFRLFDNPNVTGPPLFTDTEPLVNGMATSAGFTATATGTDFWVATYNGDTNNNSVTSGPGDEPVTVTPATPAINTMQLPPTAIVGTSISDKATVTGGFNPTGTVTFRLFNNPNGTGTPLFTDTEPLVGGMATSAAFTTTAAGTDFWVATYNGDANNISVTSGLADEPVTVTPATPAINTQQLPPTATVGTAISDKATVTGGFNPTGTVTFRLFNNPNGTGTPLFTDTEPLVGGMATSAAFTVTATGTDFWVATYNGDANNISVTSGTGDEPVTVTPATPAINTQQLPPTAAVGSTIADKATVTGGFNPTGTVTFRLFNNPNGTGTPLFTDTEPLVGGMATSAGFTATVVGTDFWVATYNGDANNVSVSSGAADEPVTVTPPSPAINTQQQPPTAVVGTSIADVATVTGGFNPTGTVTFRLFDNPNGTGTPLFTDTEPLVNGTATSAGFTTTAAGTDFWVATYNGDANNGPATSGPGDEPVTVTPATPAINTTQLPPTAIVGSTIADVATVTGGFNPTGTVTFRLFNNPNGTGTPLFTDTEPLVGGMATSAAFTTTAAGTDFWVATYNGDANNISVTSGTGDEPVTVTPATPAINTTQRPPTATVGSTIADVATVTGGFNPTGTVTFQLFDNPNGTGTPLFTDTEPLVGGMATSAGFTVTSTGTDFWVATYNGDANNNPVTSGTGDEPVTVTPATPAITTLQQPPTAIVGTTIADKATVTGGFNPTGTVTFQLFNNPNGTGVPLFTDTEPLVNGMATSAGFTTTTAGTDFWVATYNGDANNTPVTSGTASEPVVITVAQISIAGNVYCDSNMNCVLDAGDMPVGGVLIHLIRTDLPGGPTEVAETTTNDKGQYLFEISSPGIYMELEGNVANFTKECAQPGTINGQIRGTAVAVDQIANIPLASGENGINFNFALICNVPVSKQQLLANVPTNVVMGHAFATSPTFGSINRAATTTQIVAVGADAGGGPQVKVFDFTTGKQLFNFFAYAPTFGGGVRVAVGDVTGDGVPDVITAPGAGGGPQIKVFDGKTGALVRNFWAFSPSFTGGVNVAAGDVNGDGVADIITAADAGGGPQVKVFDGKTGAVIANFFAYSAAFTGGVRVAAGDFNQDGKADIVTAPGAGGGPHVKIFNSAALGPVGTAPGLINQFFAFAPTYTGGVYLAADGDITGDGKTDLVVSTGSGVGEVKVIDGSSFTTAADYIAFGPGLTTGGARVAVLDVNGDGRGDIVAGSGGGLGSFVRITDLNNRAGDLEFFQPFNPAFLGGVFVGAA